MLALALYNIISIGGNIVDRIAVVVAGVTVVAILAINGWMGYKALSCIVCFLLR